MTGMNITLEVEWLVSGSWLSVSVEFKTIGRTCWSIALSFTLKFKQVVSPVRVKAQIRKLVSVLPLQGRTLQ